ncbi:MAG: DNA polymerase III subunit delta' [Hyphomicrobiaceae bacterium]|nr:DNA polymerase III subunit delta' [Hyphomicrobiaceae bacterium]
MARAPVLQEIEAQPESDRLEGFPHPRETRDLFGHAAAERELARAFASGRMHHGWLLSGPEGIGKATLAYRLARHALAAPEERDPFGDSLGVPDETAAARQILAQAHPGLLVLRRPWDAKAKRFATTLPVDEVRRLKSFLGLTGGEGQWRLVIVDTADDLNVNAANALLKSLEEPPPRALFILISSEPGRLLPTIRSRCRRLDLRPLAPPDLRRAVSAALLAAEKDGPKPDDWERLVQLSGGSVRRALQLFAGGGLELWADVERIFALLPKVDWAAVHTLSDGMAQAQHEERFTSFVELLLETLARLVHARAAGAADGAESQLAGRLIAPEALPRWAELWEALVREKADADSLNLDRKSFILGAIGRLEAVARGGGPAPRP